MPATPDPDLAVDLAKAVVDAYAAAADKLLRDVARRLNQGITEPGWAERKLVEITNLRNAAIRELETLRAAVPGLVEDALIEAHVAGAAGVADELPEIVQSFGRTNAQAVRALVTETVTALESTHFQILRSTLDVYRQVVVEAGAADVVTGARTRRQAAQQALDRFANRGVTGFVDRAGRRWNLESYTEMAMRTTTGRAQVAGALDRMTAAGRDLVIVSDAPQECSVCRPWEGRVLSISGSTEGYPSVAAATGAGLFHSNCRHALGAYVEGVTQRFTNTEDPEGDQLRQEQRRLERGVRQWRRREAVALDDLATQKAARKRREWQSRLKIHVDQNDLKRLRYREAIGRAR